MLPRMRTIQQAVAGQFEELFKDLGYSYDDVTNDFGLEYKLAEWGDRLKNRTNYQSHSI